MIPLLIIRAYRLIPERHRPLAGSGSSSGLALAMAEAGAPWRALWRFGLRPVAWFIAGGLRDGPFWEPENTSRIPDDPWSL